jgi:hypothetical protein
MVLVEAKVIDPTHLELLRPIATAQEGFLSVTIAGAGEEDAGRDQWLAASAGTLEAAYGESEPKYSAASIRETNPDYRFA